MLWRYVNAHCGDWYMKADRRAIAMRVDAALARMDVKQGRDGGGEGKP